MAERGIGKAELARAMRTSRSQPGRILDPDNASVQPGTAIKPACSGGRCGLR